MTRARPQAGLLAATTGAMAVIAVALATICLDAKPVEASARAASIVVDANTGVTLHASNADAPRYPASLTKMMTLYLVFEAMQQGRASPATRIRFSERAAAAPPSKIGLDPGETITLQNAILSLIVKSANDVAVAVAEHFAGSEAAFAAAMTAKARAIGMSSTTFRNASGLPHSEQITTARDMALLGLRLQDDFPKFYPLFGTRAFMLDGERYTNHNSLLKRFNGTDGIKTGYIRASGFNVVTSVRHGRRHLVGAVFGGKTSSQRDTAMHNLLSKALLRASTEKTRRGGPRLVAAPRIAARAAPNQAPTAEAPERPAPARITMVNVRSVRVDQTTGEPRRSSRSPQRDSAGAPSVLRPALPPLPTTPPQPPSAGNPTQTAPPHAPVHAAPARTPSTLGQQAVMLDSRRNLESSPMGMGAGSRGIAVGPAVAGGNLEVQIGAYATRAEADKAIAAARSRAPKALASYQDRTREHRTGNGRTLFRSRFSGFDDQAAAAVCLELRRQSIDCFVARAE